jgi:hypothetical protein
MTTGPSVLGTTCGAGSAARNAERHGRLHIFLALDRQGLAADDARHVEPQDRADGDEHEHEIAAEEHDQHDHEEDERQRVEDVDDPHHDLVDTAAEIAGGRAVGDADNHGDEAGEQADGERYRPAMRVRVRRSRPVLSVPEQESGAVGPKPTWSWSARRRRALHAASSKMLERSR